MDAAVAEVLATLEVSAAVAYPGKRHAERHRHHLGHLGVESLAHLGAAVVHQHRAVGVDVHQRPAWLKCTTLKLMPNLTG